MWIAISGVVAAFVLVWLSFVVVLYVTRPDDASLKDTARLVPDAFRLVRRLAGDREIPLRTRVPVWLLVAYLASPIDLVPDFLPVVGYADDAILTALVLRRLIRKVGADKLVEHWPGSPEGLARTCQLLRLPKSN
jgi:uncharacterized membrane protein YkvA (DUF1232 family)